MISLIEALNYRCLRDVRQPLKPFHVLVGPNASGKSTFLDVVGFLHNLVTEGLEAAIESRSANFYDLVWQHRDEPFKVAIEAAIPSAQRDSLGDLPYDTIRYEVAVNLDIPSNQIGIVIEQGLLKTTFTPDANEYARSVFAKYPRSPDSQNEEHDVDVYEPERRLTRRDPASIQFHLGRRKSTLANLPEDEARFPVAIWLKHLLREKVRRIALDVRQLQRPSARGFGTGIQPDGSNLPWVVADLERKSPERLKEWVEHLQTALPDLSGITTVERPEDRSRYLHLVYRNGLKVPSWMTSEGTLRLIALTLPAFIDDFTGVYLVEEPENGIHPLAIETMYQALSWVKSGQVLLATHSPVMLAVSRAEDVLCFTRDEERGTEVVVGSEHPRLRDWKGEVDLGTLFASGVLG